VIEVIPDEGTVGTYVTIVCSGYGMNEQVRIGFGKTESIATGYASENGTFTVVFTVDTQRYGTKTIVAEGLDTGHPAYNTFYITPEVVRVIPDRGTVGTEVEVIGSGYAAGEQISVKFGKTEEIGIGYASEDGTFTIIFIVDTQVYGTKTIVCEGIETRHPAYNTYYITPEVIEVIPDEGTVGAYVTIECSGYGMNEQVRIGFGKTESIATGYASEDGTFTVVFTVDTQVYGTKTIVCEGIETRHPAYNTYYITPEVIEVIPDEGTVGTYVTIECSGYGMNEQVRIGFGKTESIATGYATEDGTFTVVFTVDTQRYGTKTIVAEGLDT
jgi:hypothetical protein